VGEGPKAAVPDTGAGQLGRRGNTSSLRHLAVASALAGVLLAWSAPAEAQAGPQGAVGAAAPPGAPGVLAKGGYYAPTVAAGATWSSVLLVSSGSAEATRMVIYGADGLTAVASGAVYSDLGQRLTAAGAWLRPVSQRVLVPAGGEVKVRFAVTVPANATPGDHLLGIAAQPSSAKPSGTGRLRVVVVARAVVGILVRVPGPAAFDVTVGAPRIGRGPEHVGEVVTPVTDTGRLIGKPIDTVTLRGPGRYERTVRTQLGTLLPGGTAQFPVYWPDPMHGGYVISSCLSGAGLLHPVCHSARAGVGQVTSVGQITSTAATPVGTGTKSPAGLFGWSIALLSATLGCGLAAGVVRRRRSRRAAEEASPIPPEAVLESRRR
jgi:hypothetical protein